MHEHAGSAGELEHTRAWVRCSERGANLLEYCLLVVLILLACIAGVTQFGKKVPADSFVSVSAAL